MPAYRKFYLRHTNADTACDTVSPALPFDLSETAGGSESINSGSIDDTAFQEAATFDIALPASVAKNGQVSASVSVDMALVGADTEYRFRLRALTAACGVDNSSVYSSAFTSAGVQTFTLPFSIGQNVTRIRLSCEVRRSAGSGAKFVRFRASMSSFVAFRWATRLQRISDAIVARTAAILTASGYNCDIDNTGVRRVQESQSPGEVSVYVWARNIPTREVSTGGRGAPGHIRAQAEFLLRLVKVGGDDPMQDALNLTQDVVAAVEGDPDMLGLHYVHAIRVSEVIDARSDEEIMKPAGMADVVVLVEYRCMRGEL